MRSFTDEEYKIMIYELTEREPVCFDMLCAIAERTLKGTVYRWCNDDIDLRGKALEEDIMQDIFVRLIKTCVTHFLMRDDRGGEINRDPAEFYSWMFTVAANIKKDYAKAQRGITRKTAEEDESLPAPYAFKSVEDNSREVISEAFRTAVTSGKRPYIILTWLTVYLLMLRYDLTKIEATQYIVDVFSDYTLSRLTKRITHYMDASPWLDVPREELSACFEKLGEVGDDGAVPADKLYREFFMEKGGKATISDWVNRMNSYIKGRINYEAFDE